MAINWTNASRDVVREVVAAAPEASYDEYVRLLGERGLAIEKPEGVRRILRDLDLGTQERRRAYAQQRVLGGIVSGTYAQEAPRLRSRFEQVRDYCASWAEKNAPERIRVLDFSNATAPIALVHSSDWHIGQKSVQYHKLRADNTLILNTEGAYMAAVGDLIDNTKPQRKSRGSLYTSVMGPDEQWEYLQEEADPLIAAEKIVSVVTGNHDHWDWDESGVDTMKAWCRFNGLPYHGHGGVFKVLVGDQAYYAILRHEYIGGGGKNKTLGPLNMYDRYPRPREAAHLDWTFTGHLHFALQYPADHAAGECHHLRGGTYQHFTDWADQKVGVQYSNPGTPTVVLYPDQHKIKSFKGTDLEDAMEYLTYQREKYGR